MTQEAKHTPGPWVTNGSQIHKADTSIPLHICTMPHHGGGKSEVGEANARLIAAAPELLAELQRELGWLQHIKPQVQAPKSVMTGFEQAIRAISAAIAKATGKEAA